MNRRLKKFLDYCLDDKNVHLPDYYIVNKNIFSETIKVTCRYVAGGGCISGIIFGQFKTIYFNASLDKNKFFILADRNEPYLVLTLKEVTELLTTGAVSKILD